MRTIAGTRLRDDRSGRRALPEHEVHDEQSELVEHRHDGDREERRVRAVAAGRLAVAADPVARERQHERREAERAERGRVDDEPGEEAADRTDDAAAEQGDRDERDEQHVGHGAEDVDLREDRDLGDRCDEEQGGGLDAVADGHRCRLLRDEHRDRFERAEVRERLHLHLEERGRVRGVDAYVTVPIGMPYG